MNIGFDYQTILSMPEDEGWQYVFDYNEMLNTDGEGTNKTKSSKHLVKRK